MRKLVVFQQVSVDGYFVDRNGGMTWAKNDNDEEFNAFTAENAEGGGILLFGRVTTNSWPVSGPQRKPGKIFQR
jgi:dihydrofolate reductase